MNPSIPRRTFLKSAAATGVGVAAADWFFVSKLPRVSAAEARLDRKLVQLQPDIEPLVRLIEDSSRDVLLERVAEKIKSGVAYQQVLAALFLAGVRGIQPRPVGFKFHAVLVVNAAHLASLASPDADRWLPIFWALDNFKEAQARNKREGDWTMAPVDEPAVPPSHKAREMFMAAMDAWDVSGADAAVAGLARTATPMQIFETFCRYGMRDFREIGHKAIYVANSWRTLQTIGWRHAEPILRSLAYALLDHEGENPAKRDAAPDRPYRQNLERAQKIRNDWLTGTDREKPAAELIQALRSASTEEACEKAVALLNSGADPAALWDAALTGAGELLMRAPGIGSLHALTSGNALHFAFHHTADDLTRRLLLLQAVAYSTLFRGAPKAADSVRIDEFKPAETETLELGEVFAEISRDRLGAAKKALAYLRRSGDPASFINQARRLVFLKGRDAHDYKFSAAVLEDYHQIAPRLRDRYLAATVFQLRGSGDTDNGLVQRTRQALG